MIDMNILFSVGLATLFIHAKPIIFLKRFLLKEEDYDSYPPIKQWIFDLTHCLYCISFWIGLCFSFQVAVIASLLAFIIDNRTFR
jgi:hypothetical protein